MFAGGILQARYLVEHPMIKRLVNRRPDGLHVGKIHHPTGHWMHRTGHDEFHTKGMAMQSTARVTVGYVRQSPRAGQRELGREFRFGGGEVRQRPETGSVSRSEPRTASRSAATPP